ncbi:MAG: dihydrofolate reductase [Nocardioides sp.]
MTEQCAGKRIVLVAAYAANRAIGLAGGMPWHIGADFAHFKVVTMGHILVMGRATFDSIGRPLPGRSTIVITRDRSWRPPDSPTQVLVAHSWADALSRGAELPGDLMVAGGAQIYALALPDATHQILTEVQLEPEADRFYPDYDKAAWEETNRVDRPDLGLSWVWLERRVAAVSDSLRI